MSPKRRAQVLTILGLWLSAMPAVAQQPTEPPPIPLPELTVPGLLEQGYVVREATSGTKADTPLIETPHSVSVITRDRLEAQGVTTLAEALRYTAGVEVESFGFEPRFTQLTIRGFDATTTGLYRDGLQLRNPAFAVSYNLEPYGVERIEILKGPVSILYGASDPGGLVNLVSERPTWEPRRVVAFEAGSFDRVEGKFDLSGPVGSGDVLAYRLTGLVRDSETQVDFIQDDRLFLAPAVTWRPRPGTTLTLLAHYQEDSTKSRHASFVPSTSARSGPGGPSPAASPTAGERASRAAG